MAVGFRMFKDFQRPEPELVEAFRGIPSSNIGDCVRKMTCMFAVSYTHLDVYKRQMAYTPMPRPGHWGPKFAGRSIRLRSAR